MFFNKITTNDFQFKLEHYSFLHKLQKKLYCLLNSVSFSNTYYTNKDARSLLC